MSRSRAATFSLYIVIALLLPVSLAHASGKAADAQCPAPNEDQIYKAGASCGETIQDGNKKKVNLYGCQCSDSMVRGICTRVDYCEGKMCQYDGVWSSCALPSDSQLKGGTGQTPPSGTTPGNNDVSKPSTPNTSGSIMEQLMFNTKPIAEQTFPSSAENVAEQIKAIGQTQSSDFVQQMESRFGNMFSPQLSNPTGIQSPEGIPANSFTPTNATPQESVTQASTFSQTEPTAPQGDTLQCGWTCTIQDYAGKAWDAIAKEFGGSAEAKTPVNAQIYGKGFEEAGGSPNQKLAFAPGTRGSNPYGFALTNTQAQALGLSPGDKAEISMGDKSVIGVYDDNKPPNRVAPVDINSDIASALGCGGGTCPISMTKVPSDTPLGPVSVSAQVPLPVASPMRLADTAITDSVMNSFGGSYPSLPTGQSITEQFLAASNEQFQSNAVANVDFATSGDTGISTGVAPAQSNSNPDFASSGDTGIATPAQEFPASPSGVVTRGPDLGEPNPAGVVTRGPDLEQPNPVGIVERGPDLTAPAPFDISSGQHIPAQSALDNLFATPEELTQIATQQDIEKAFQDRLALADEQTQAFNDAVESGVPKPDTTLPTGEALTNQMLKEIESQVPVPEPANVHLPTQDEMISALVPKSDTSLPTGEVLTNDILKSSPQNPGGASPFTGPEPIELATQPVAPSSNVPKGLEGLINPPGLTPQQLIDLNKEKLGEALDNPKYQGIQTEMTRAALVDALKQQNAESQQKLDDLPLPKDQTPEQAQQYRDLKASIDANEAAMARQSEILKGPIADMNAEQLQKYIDTTKTYINAFPPDTPGIVAGLNYRLNMAQEQLNALDRATIANIDATAAQGRLDNPVFEAPGPAGTVAFFQNEYNKVLAEQKSLDDMLNVWNATPAQYAAYNLQVNGLEPAPAVDFSKFQLIGASEQPGSLVGGDVTSIPASTVIPNATEVAAEAKPLSPPGENPALPSTLESTAFAPNAKPYFLPDFQNYVDSKTGEPLTPEQIAGLKALTSVTDQPLTPEQLQELGAGKDVTAKLPDTIKTETITPQQDPNVALAEKRVASLAGQIDRLQRLFDQNVQDPQALANAKASVRAALASADNTTAALKGTGSDVRDIALVSERLHELSADLNNTSLSRAQIADKLDQASAMADRWDQALPDTPKPYTVRTIVPGETYTIPAMTAAEGVSFADAYSQYQSVVGSNTSVPAQLTGNWEPQYPSDNIFPTQQEFTQIADQANLVNNAGTLVSPPNNEPSLAGTLDANNPPATEETTTKTPENAPSDNLTNCISESCVGGELGDARSRPLSPEEQALQKQIADAEAQKATLQKQLSALPANANVNGLIAKAQAGLDAMHSDRKPTAAETATMKEGAAAIRQLQQIAKAAGDTEMANDLAGISGRLSSIDAKAARFSQLSAQSALGDLGAYSSPEGNALVKQLQSGVNSIKADAPGVLADTRSSDLPGQIADVRETAQGTIAELNSQIAANRQSLSLLQEANIPRVPDTWASQFNPETEPAVVVSDARTSGNPATPAYAWEPQYPSDNIFPTQQEFTQIADQANLVNNAGTLVSPPNNEPSLAGTLDANNPPSKEEALSAFVQDRLNSLTEQPLPPDTASTKVVPSNDALTEVPEKPAPGIFDSVKAWAQGTVDQLREYAFNREMASMVPFRPVEQSGEDVTQQVKDAAANTPGISSTFEQRWAVPTAAPVYPSDNIFPTQEEYAKLAAEFPSVPTPQTPAPAPVYPPDSLFPTQDEYAKLAAEFPSAPKTQTPPPSESPAPETPAPKPVVIAKPAPVDVSTPGPQAGPTQQQGPAGNGIGGGGGGGITGALSSMLGSLMRMLGIGQPQQSTPRQPTSPTRPSTTTPQSATSTPPIPTVNLIANPASTVAGKKATLSWSGIGVTQCVVFAQDGTQLVAGGSSGSVPTPVLATTTAFRVSCAASVGAPVGASVSVTVR